MLVCCASLVLLVCEQTLNAFLFGGFAFRDYQDMNFSRLPSFFIGSHARFGEAIRSSSYFKVETRSSDKSEDYLSERNYISRKSYHRKF